MSERKGILALDTSSLSVTSAGVYFSPDCQAEWNRPLEGSQQQQLVEIVDRVLAQTGKTVHDIRTVALGMGPGSFTGLRIGMSFARALAWSENIDIVGFSSLYLLALSVDPGLRADSLVIPVTDARMKRVYTAVFDAQDGLKHLFPDSDLTPDDFVRLTGNFNKRNIVIVGDGLTRYPEFLTLGSHIHFLPETVISGAVICQTALDSSAEYTSGLDKVFPAYLRKSEAEINWEKK